MHRDTARIRSEITHTTHALSRGAKNENATGLILFELDELIFTSLQKLISPTKVNITHKGRFRTVLFLRTRELKIFQQKNKMYCNLWNYELTASLPSGSHCPIYLESKHGFHPMRTTPAAEHSSVSAVANGKRNVVHIEER